MTAVTHHRTTVDGVDTFYRAAGPVDAPVLLLPHGYPASSYVYRNLMARLGDRWRSIAPDLPGFGYSATPSPEDFDYTFAAYSRFLQSLVDTMDLSRYVIWLHDYGSQFGFQLAIAKPERVAGLVIQNGDIYEDAFGPKYDFLKESWNNPGPASRRRIAQHVTLHGFETEFRGELPDYLADRISPDLWTLHWSLMSTPERIANLIRLLEDQPTTLDWFAGEQAYLREHQPPALIVWGPHDGYMPAKSAQAYRRDLPDVPIHLLGGGHWLLETHLDEVVPLIDEFLTTAYAN
ncbi:alpha/beta fold hydrolase [Mycolicibacterium neworleansense]|uniref:Alpha/beta hydrolase n=1 Tax=Mycolicibacterium neworleansense TaxID=146018 RepID=A0A0H5S943_9MYCO|nr:alpha/beta hydrolase [Mycolicibacterium neworleansense]MCV7360548.1 alpha/beta hydrolase [Mycolicibacterium neworleansense]CRZ17834.1 alpha/beta hydrolase [Mycolicibacterium neworleansense]